MICPECKKNSTSVVNSNYEKFINSIKRDRYCTCGHKFITYEINQSEFRSQTLKIQKTFKKVNKVKRWKGYRFLTFLKETSRTSEKVMKVIKSKPRIMGIY